MSCIARMHEACTAMSVCTIGNLSVFIRLHLHIILHVSPPNSRLELIVSTTSLVRTWSDAFPDSRRLVWIEFSLIHD